MPEAGWCKWSIHYKYMNASTKTKGITHAFIKPTHWWVYAWVCLCMCLFVHGLFVHGVVQYHCIGVTSLFGTDSSLSATHIFCHYSWSTTFWWLTSKTDQWPLMLLTICNPHADKGCSGYQSLSAWLFMVHSNTLLCAIHCGVLPWPNVT